MLYIDKYIIENIKTFNFLGLHINNKLTWDTYINHISLQISGIGTMNRLNSLHILHMIYNSLIVPHINYCLIMWGFHSSRILILQKRAMRTITNSWYRAHTEPIFKNLNILKVHDLYWLMVLKFYYKLKKTFNYYLSISMYFYLNNHMVVQFIQFGIHKINCQ